ncbi:trypsin-like serine protease [Micromonospora sp. WMMD1120]|uniref:S1 family peptidase n=1 Tax=Micromonospora sp. WMMD1120 TaxID=3016106 RepID=UPI002416B44A|nr:trypsin-like serine protease [Micromonospora sp. WMMD1120]MDG4808069.1 trypsin-like serine protease [Micromonospora sp. WMMD1120]
MSAHRARRWGAALLGATIAANLLGGASAQAVTGTQPVPDGSHLFSAKVTFGEVRACSGALVDPSWVLTARSCFAEGAGPVAAGPPSRPSTVLVGRTDLTSTAGQRREIASVVPHPDRDLALVRLFAPVTDVPPVPLATTAPAATETLTVTGYGRTATEWVPDRLHQGAFTVRDVTAGSVGLLGASAGTTLCKGDAGGPAFRDNAGTVELVAVASTSWQKGCLSETETRDGATATRVDDLGGWFREQLSDVQVFSVVLEPQTFVRRLTYHAIDSATGAVRASRAAAEPLPFGPRAMATLNADTILMNDGAGKLYRVDVTGMSPFTYTMTPIDTDWTHDQLVYDGYGSLYGIRSGSTLTRHTVTSPKPVKEDLTAPTTIGSGFGLTKLTSPGPGRILGTDSTGYLISYKINGVNSWSRSDLYTSGWGSSGHLVSPGGGLYLTFDPFNGLTRYRDANPFDGKSTDITILGTESIQGRWRFHQEVSARPWRGVVSVYGTRPDGRLSYTTVDPVTGKRRTIVSAGTLGFTPKAMAVLNSDTLLVTSTEGQLYRVDITGSDPLTFDRTASLSGGWTHDRLAYDGNGSLYGIANGATLRRYTVTTPKPVYADITNAKTITGTFALTSLAAPGPGRILGTTSAGKLMMYLIDASGTSTAAEIGASGWADTTALFSPGGGLYHKRLASGQVVTYLDASPFDGKGSDIKPHLATVDSTGWDPILSARPYDSWPDSTRQW